MRVSLAGLACSSALLLLVPAAAHAAKPILLGPISDEGIAAVINCPGFEVFNHYVVTFVARSTVDRQGDVIRLAGQTWGSDTFMNPISGKEITSRYHNNTTIDFRTGEAAIRGVISKVIVPGVGPILKDVGRVVIDDAGNVTFRAGPHQYVDGDFEALCAALE